MKGNDQHPRIKQIKETIETGLAGDLSVATLARRSHLSPSRVAHLFKCATGTSIASYVRQRRIQKATQLLSESSLSIKEIAAALNFRDGHHFSRLFTRMLGYPPSIVRKNNRN